MSHSKIGILLVGPFPPPFAGQSILVKNIVEGRLAEIFDIELLNVTHRMPGLFKRLSLSVWFTSRLILKLVRPNTIKLLHIHTSAGIPFYEKSLFSILGKLFGKKVLLHIHGGKFGYFWETSGPLRRFWIKTLLNCNDRIIVLSDGRQHYFAKQIRCKAETITLPNAVKIEEGVGLDVDPDVTTFLYVGHLKREKGLLDLLEALRLLEKDGTPHLRIWLMGKGDTPQNEQEIRKAFGESKIQFVEFLGVLAGEEKWRKFAAADVFILPSHSEDMPISILEAMASGLPVIAGSVGAIPEIVTDGVNGYLIGPGDVQALAEKMKFMVENKILRIEIGFRNKQKVEKDFSFDKYEKKLAQIYFDILGTT